MSALCSVLKKPAGKALGLDLTFGLIAVEGDVAMSHHGTDVSGAKDVHMAYDLLEIGGDNSSGALGAVVGMRRNNLGDRTMPKDGGDGSEGNLHTFHLKGCDGIEHGEHELSSLRDVT